MKSEKELIREISRIGEESQSVGEAAAVTQSLLATEMGVSTLLLVEDSVPLGISPTAAKSASDFLDSHEFPFRGLYTAPLMAGDRKAGRLIACFGSFGSPGAFLERLTIHIAGQFGQLLDRNQRDAHPRTEAA
jgi:hypothetical protein